MEYRFVINEKPIGKQRPRFDSRTGRVYTPTATRSFEDKVKWTFTSKYNIATELSTKPFEAYITAIFKPPESLSKVKQQKLREVDFWVTKKPDVDNIAKIILDSLNGLAYKDDSQVSRLEIWKQYGKEDSIEVLLREIEEDIR